MILLFLTRRKRMTKDEWRQPGLRRTLDPTDIEPVIRECWSGLRFAPDGSIFEAQLTEAGDLAGAPAPSPRGPALWQVEWKKTAVTLRLREEEAPRQLGTPRRPSKLQVARLAGPWGPVRITLNGRQASTAGQHYNLLEQYAVLCADPMPDLLLPARWVDLEADLL